MKRALAILLLSLAAVLRGEDAVPAPLSPYWVTNSVLRATTNVPPAAVSNLLATPLPVPRGASLQAYLGRDVRAALPAPAPTSGVDCCFLPLGFHECAATPLSVGSPASILICEPDTVRAVVWRLRRDIAAGAIVPVLVEHAATNVAGRVLATWYDPARGGMARLALAPAGEAAYAARKRDVSPSMLELYASTAASVSTNGVAYPADRFAFPWRVLELSLVRRGRLPDAGTVGAPFLLSTASATPTR